MKLFSTLRICFSLAFAALTLFCRAQDTPAKSVQRDSLLIINADVKKGFRSGYLLFIPKGTPISKKTFLLVEPNNTGQIADSIEVHLRHAIALASASSVGNNISTELKIPLLVPVFSRPATDSLMYTHALDRDVMLEKRPEYHRLDLQLLAMVDDAKLQLTKMGIDVNDKFFMSGFSASGTFTNRFSLLHPEKIQALAIGGFNGKLMIPQNRIKVQVLNYPIGTNDFTKLFGSHFNIDAYRRIPQYIYLGKLDDNDAVQYDDAYSENERRIINKYLGTDVQQRYLECQRIYRENKIDARFISYEKIGHWTTGAVNLDVIRFFLAQMTLQ